MLVISFWDFLTFKKRVGYTQFFRELGPVIFSPIGLLSGKIKYESYQCPWLSIQKYLRRKRQSKFAVHIGKPWSKKVIYFLTFVEIRFFFQYTFRYNRKPQITSVTKISIPSAVVYYYCAWYTYFRNGRYKYVPRNIGYKNTFLIHIGPESVISVTKSCQDTDLIFQSFEMSFWCQRLDQNTNENISRISALASKKRSNQK